MRFCIVSLVHVCHVRTHLVCSDIAVELCQLAVGAHPQLVGSVGDESLVVRDADDAALELRNGEDQGVETLDIQVVSRLKPSAHLPIPPQA